MEKLVSINEIKKEGFKQESKSTYKKGKERYVKCRNCDCWNYTRNSVNANNILKLPCFWCDSGVEVRMNKK